MKIPFSPPFINQEIIDEVTAVLQSGWITSGPKVKALEQAIQQYTGAQQAICVNAATNGLILMLDWFGVGPGDEVIVPAYTYAATAIAVMRVGATPVMLDISDDFNVDATKIIDAITTKTKAIIPVDFGGWPCNYDAIFSTVLEKKHIFQALNEVQKKLGRILVLADTAHSLGAEYKNKKSGTYADISVFSLHAVKNVTTAEGGVICLNLPEKFDQQALYQQLKVRSLNGQTKDAFTKTQAGNWRYDIVEAGFKMNMPDLCAAVGLVQLKYYSKLLQKRKNIFKKYNDYFKTKDWAILPPFYHQDAHSACHLYALRVKDITEEQRNRMIQFMTNEGVASNVHFLPLPLLTAFKNNGYNIKNYPVAYQNFSHEISLPIYPQLQENQIAKILHTVSAAYDEVKKVHNV